MLHVTNGEVAASKIKAAGVLGDVLPWDDVLHEGPVPGDTSPEELRRIRAEFIAAQGWDSAENALAALTRRDRALSDVDRTDEVVLWFEHDLFDQLQLVQVLSALAARAERPSVSLAQSDDYLGTLDVSSLRELYATRRDLGASDLEFAARVWAAFSGDDPRDLQRLARAKSPLPFVPDAIARLLEEFPDARDGLSRTERQILAAAVAEPTPLDRVFERESACEHAVFLGDSAFVVILARMLADPAPLLRLLSREPLGNPHAFASHAEFWDRAVTLTPLGQEVLAGKRDWLEEQGIDRWLGGVHLDSPSCWRWDGERRRAVAPRS